jgi:hypothetical protein
MIHQWLKAFENAWTSKDIDQVLGLFTNDMEYWEAPFQRIENKEALNREWGAIITQNNIHLDLSVFSSVSNKHAVIWKLSYTNEASVLQEWAGTYLIELDAAGKCRYFYQTGEQR